MSILTSLINAVRRRSRRPATPVAPAPGGLTRQVLDRTKLVCFHAWKTTTSQYTRYQDLFVLEGASVEIDFYGDDLDGGGPRVLLNSTYTLLVDDVPTVTNGAFTNGGRDSSFILALPGITEGWHKFGIDCGATGETCPVIYMYVKRGTGQVPDQEEIPIFTGSYSINHHKTDHFYGMVPKAMTPTSVPLSLTPRECPHFATAVNRTLLYREQLIPFRDDDVHRVNVNHQGVYSTLNTQSYQWANFVKKYPRMALLDGARGVGTGQMFTHIHPDRHGGVYFADPWRIGRVRPDGLVITRCGYRHPTYPNYKDDNDLLIQTSARWFGFANGPQQVMELIGDWSAVTVKGFHETWGLAWDLNSLTLNEGAPTIFNPANGENEFPHASGPRLFVTDSQNNRVLLLTFQPDSFDAEPVVTEFLTGLNDPWDIVWDNGSIYVSERFDSRIVQYNATTGAFIRIVVSGPTDMAEFTQPASRESPRPKLPYVLDDLRAEDVVWPEGLFLQDGWLYYASSAMQQVKRINLTSDVKEWVCNPRYGNNTNFFKIALSDGTFGPRGTVAVASWEQFKSGLPEMYLQDGLSTVWSTNTAGSAGIASGKGGQWVATEYSSAAGIANGRQFSSSSRECLTQTSLALASDPTITNAQRTLYAQGHDEWLANGYQLLHGHGGWGLYGLPLPWGESDAIDFYLENNGHTNPGA